MRTARRRPGSAPSPALLCFLLKGLRPALALLVQLVAPEPQELDDTDLPRCSELTFLVLLVAVLLQSATQRQPIRFEQVGGALSYRCV